MIFVATSCERVGANSVERLIQRSAWSRISANFALHDFCELRRRGFLGSSLSSGSLRMRPRVRREASEDGIGDAPLEAPQSLLTRFTLRDLLAVVGSPLIVRPGLAGGDHMQGVVELAVASQREPVAHHLPA